MTEIVVEAAELEAGKLSDFKLAQAREALLEDGFVVLKGVVDLEHIKVLHDRSVQDAELLINRKDAPFNWNVGNLQQDPPPFPPYLFRDVLANDIVIQVTKSILGAGLKNAFYSGNTALPSDSRQPVHADSGQLWPNLKVATPAYGLVVNVPLVDVDAENASTEIWPGTHLDTSVVMQDGDIKVAPEILEKRRAEVPPIQPTVSAGSVIIRDLRLWHAGMPNRTLRMRPMIAMIHFVNWFPTGPIKFPKGTEAIFQHPDLITHAEFTDEPIDHISTPHGFEFESK